MVPPVVAAPARQLHAHVRRWPGTFLTAGDSMRRFTTKVGSDDFQAMPRVVKGTFHPTVERILFRFGSPKICIANGTRENDYCARIVLHKNYPTVSDLARVRLHDRIRHSSAGGAYWERNRGERTGARRC